MVFLRPQCNNSAPVPAPRLASFGSIVLVAFTLIAHTSAAADKPTGAPFDSPSYAPATSGPAGHSGAADLEKIRDILRLLMLLMGGNPDTLPSEPNAAMEVVLSYYTQAGLPQGLGEDEAAKGRSLVRDAYNTILTGSLLLNPLSVSVFIDMLQSMYTELGGEPADIPDRI